MRRFRTPIRALRAAASALALGLAPMSAAAIPVYDAANHVQNIVQAARTLEQINHQIAQLQNEAAMLINQARHLARLPYSVRAELENALARTNQLLREAQRLAYEIAQIEQVFAEQYGLAAASGDQAEQVALARERWRTSLAAFEDALRVQAGVVANLETARIETGALVGQSQAAVGSLQAAQAGNQLLALQNQQIADLTAVLTAAHRAEALEQARRVSAEVQARENLSRFLAPGAGYTPGAAEMFPGG